MLTQHLKVIIMSNLTYFDDHAPKIIVQIIVLSFDTA